MQGASCKVIQTFDGVCVCVCVCVCRGGGGSGGCQCPTPVVFKSLLLPLGHTCLFMTPCTAACQRSPSPHPCQQLLFVVFLTMAIPTSVRWYLIVAVSYIFLIMSDVESIFSCTCWLCVSLLEKCLFFNCFWGCFPCWIVYIFCILTPYRKWLANISSHSVMSFAVQELFNLT